MVLEINSIVPVTGRLNQATNITLFGTDFGAGATVQIGSTPATNVLIVASDRITCTVPSGLEEESYDIRIEVGTENAILENAFIIVPALPEYPFTDQTYERIQTRILNRLSSKYEKFEGSTIHDFFAPISMEFAETYLSMSTIRDLIFLITSKGAYLDFHGIEYGISRRKATKAKGFVTITATSALTIDKGTRISNTPDSDEDQVVFITDSKIMLPMKGATYESSVGITAIERGKSGNLAIGFINKLVTLVNEVTNVTNSAVTTGGSNREEDPPYLSRILSQIRTPARAGNVEDYKQWARAASEDVGKVGVDPLRKDEHSGNNQAGEVGVYILKSDDTVPDSALISLVQNYIGPDAEGKGRAPVGANPTVAVPNLINIHVKVDISPSSGFIETEVQEIVKEVIADYINNLDIGENIIYHTLGSIIHTTNGVNLITAYFISSSNTNPADVIDIVINNTQKARIGTVTVT